MLSIFIFILFGVINVHSECTISTYDECTCTSDATAQADCAELQTYLGLAALQGITINDVLVCDGTTGKCTLTCDKDASVCTTAAMIGLVGFTCDPVDKRCIPSSTTPATTQTAVTDAATTDAATDAPCATSSNPCTLNQNDPLGSVMGCTCSSNSACNCEGLQSEIDDPANAVLKAFLVQSVGNEGVVCDESAGYCTLSCNNGQSTCDTAAGLVGNDVSLTCSNDQCTKGTATTQAATTQAADTTDATDATDAATTQSATNSATDAATTQSATDAATTQSATDAATTQSATDAVTTLDCDSVVPVWSAPECGYNPLDGCGIRVDFTAYVCNLGKGLQKKKRIKTAIKRATLDVVGAFENNDVVCTEDMLVVGKPNEPFIQVKQLRGQQTVADAYALDGVGTADGCPTVDELCDTDESLVFEIQARVELHCAVCADLFGLGRYLLSESEDIEFLENYDQFLADASAAQDDVCGVGFGTVNLQSPIYVAIVDENGEVLGDLERSVDLGSNAAYRSYVGAFVVVMGVLSFVY
eukprot:611490_1